VSRPLTDAAGSRRAGLLPVFQFAVTIDTRGVALEVRALADALPIVKSMFGEPS
jgi:hypothetical protein